ncbi:MAG: hypothetical protein MPN21_09710 [Thermoanaerobaculia bacterium]|nr:hypothetical protein [Thermoanaerobaculia bacterium]
MNRHQLLVASFVGLCLAFAVPAQAQLSDPDSPPRVQASEEDEAQPQDVFFDVVTVDEVSVVVRVTDRRGQPILGLERDDVAVRVGREVVPVAGLRWHSSEAATFSSEDGQPGDPELRTTSSSMAPAPVDSPAIRARSRTLDGAEGNGAFDEDGKLLVLFVQVGHHQVVTFDASWVTGHMKALPSMRRLLASLPATDRVAVVSFDSKLKLWQDFSRDRRATGEALWDAVGFGTPEVPAATEGPSLVDTLDFDAAEEATSPEEALHVLGEALAAWREPKEIIFLGWGLGRLVGGMVSMPRVYRDALASLQEAQATVHVLNVVQMGGNALAFGLVNVAEATGGTYGSTFEFGRRKIERLGRVLGGYYLLTLDPDDFPGVRGRLRIGLRRDLGLELRDVRIHHRKMVVQGRQTAR